MAVQPVPPDFKEFLRLLNEHSAKYLLVGGYAVNFYGYVRATADMDIWIALNPENARIVESVLREFGFDVPELSIDLLLTEGKIIRMGYPPVRLEVINRISGVIFEECYAERTVADLDGVEASIISLKHLRINKLASGRDKDLVDVRRLPID